MRRATHMPRRKEQAAQPHAAPDKTALLAASLGRSAPSSEGAARQACALHPAETDAEQNPSSNRPEMQASVWRQQQYRERAMREDGDRVLLRCGLSESDNRKIARRLHHRRAPL